MVSAHTVKPLDREGIANALRHHAQVIVLEEMVPHGSMAGQVKEIAWDTHARCRLDTFTLQDRFIHNYGSHNDLLSAHGLDLQSISSRLNLG